MSGPTKILEGWFCNLGQALTELELGLTYFNLDTCLHFLTQFPHLTSLRLKGAPSNSLPTILSHLPNLENLDTEYTLLPVSSSSFSRRAHSLPVHGQSANNKEEQPQPPIIRTLTVRTTALDALGPQKLWTWIHNLVPRKGLQKLRLHSFTLYGSGCNTSNMWLSGFASATASSSYTSANASTPAGDSTQSTMFPKMFMLELAIAQRDTLCCLEIDGLVLSLGDFETVLELFPRLEELHCAIRCNDAASLSQTFSNSRYGQNLKMLRFARVHWNLIPTCSLTATAAKSELGFTRDNAKCMMLRRPSSKLRVIGVGEVLFVGKWARDSTASYFEVTENVERNRW
ncbi:hypothetical protein D9758_006306 [Tetrapyrgos nigripes]|uniref:Uncharacterized protein n=1 Tax=Tetrapyrgos nigripes TaxID=182062 RepID=A0A8H5D951_9AGAR|nr:hypothetical protein D9758_006306 [Tetrapyrgos nigripes]